MVWFLSASQSYNQNGSSRRIKYAASTLNPHIFYYSCCLVITLLGIINYVPLPQNVHPTQRIRDFELQTTLDLRFADTGSDNPNQHWQYTCRFKYFASWGLKLVILLSIQPPVCQDWTLNSCFLVRFLSTVPQQELPLLPFFPFHPPLFPCCHNYGSCRLTARKQWHLLGCQRPFLD